MSQLYKVLFVDDEEDVRRAAIRKLDWAALGFEVAGEAGNGEEALELAERVQPDVIMTDIKMPFMDGLELCRRVKRLWPGTRMAILSGFDEFEYAREAITHQVEDYILKPIDAESLAAVFTRIRESLDEEIRSRRDMEVLRRHYQESLPIMREQALTELLSGSMVTDMLRDKIRAYGLDLSADAYCVAVLHHDASAEDGRFLPISLRELVSECLAGIVQAHTLQTPNHIAIVFLLDRGMTPEGLIDVLRRLFPRARRLLNLNLHIGLGRIYARAEDLSRSYREASGALEYQFLLEPDQCIYIGDIEPGTESERMPDAAYTDELLRQIKVGSRDDVQRAVSALIAHLHSAHAIPQQCQIYLLELFTDLFKLIRSYRMDEREARLDVLLGEGMSMRFGDLDELGRWLLTYCENLRALARQERKDSMRTLVDSAIHIIENGYMDSALSLESICAQLNVSTPYFSTLFKRETGKGFISYLTGVRMDRALELLNATDEKTYRIAERIGYTDPNYFSYVFKKYMGISPTKYRAGRAQSDGTI